METYSTPADIMVRSGRHSFESGSVSVLHVFFAEHGFRVFRAKHKILVRGSEANTPLRIAATARDLTDIGRFVA